MRLLERERRQQPALDYNTENKTCRLLGRHVRDILCWRRSVSTRRRACFAGSFILFEHDLFGKPVPTFPDHALGRVDSYRIHKTIAARVMTAR